MVDKLTKTVWYKAFIDKYTAIAIDIANKLIIRIGKRALKYFTVAIAISIFVNIIFLLWLPSHNVTYTTIQFIWPILSLFLLARIYYTSVDRNVKIISKLFYIVLVPWTITSLLLSLILPFYYDNDLAYYITDFGFLLGYLILIHGLYRFKNFKQWSLVTPSKDFIINVTGVLASIFLVALVLLNIKWNSNGLVDIWIFLAYLICDIVILSLCFKLINMNIELKLNYLIFIIIGFIAINSLADLFYEIRYLFSLNYVFSYKIGQLTDMIYNISLMTMTIALVFYNTNVKNKALDMVHNKLQESRLFIEDIIMQAPYAICIFDKKGDLVSVNSAFLALFNVKRSEVIGNYNLFKDTNAFGIKLNPAILKVKKGKTIVIPKIEFPDKNGKVLYLSAKAFPTFGTNNRISNYVAIIEDITEQLKAQQELVSAKTQAELYVDLMGHDISNIHQIAMGYLELANEKLNINGNLVKDDEALILKPIENLINGSRLIDNVRKLQGEKTGIYNKKNVDIDEVLEEVKYQFLCPSDRDIKINFEIKSGCKVTVNDLLKDVFINVLGNAVKHSKDPLVIDVKSECVSEADGKFCKVTVEDNGPGIPDNRKLEIFERMHCERGKITGKGIGLYLVKTLIDDYHGKIWVEDRVPGDYTKGSRFVIMLPIVEN